MMIDLEHDLVAIEVALQVAKERVALIGGGQQRKQRPGFGRSKRLDRLTLAVVGDGRRAGNFRAPPEPQIGRKEKCLVSPDRPAHIGIEVVAFVIRLAGKSVGEVPGRSTWDGFLKERNGVQSPVAEDFGRHAVELVAARLRREDKRPPRASTVFGLGGTRDDAELLDSIG